MEKQRNTFYCRFGKRALDILVSGVAIVALSPLLLLLSLLVIWKHGKPVFFTPTRPGLNEKIFRMYKFRSMSNARDSEGNLLPEKDRLTTFGRLLRASSLDELPELFNVFKGDMSLVGPRPLAKGYLPFYTAKQRIRHTVRPGLTGLAQISGRNNLMWDKRIEKDIEYIQSLSLKTDVDILIGTVMKVIKSSDIQDPGTGVPVDLIGYNFIKEEGEKHIMSEKVKLPEIGSHFWLSEKTGAASSVSPVPYPKTEDSTLTFSGRSAIRLALEDALKTKTIKTAYVPSYCCLSMLQPLIDLGIKYSFYDIVYDGKRVHYKISANKQCDLLLIMEYFGLGDRHTDAIIRKMKAKGCVVIEDVTHSLLSRHPGCSDSDYYVASLRKWFEVPTGGWLGKTRGSLKVKPDTESNVVVEERIAAMQEKREYILHGTANKEEYLKKFAAFENDLTSLNSMLKLDDVSESLLKGLDADRIAARRKENAVLLYERLKDVRGIRFLIEKFNPKMNTPLFVPIMVENGQRDALRQYLIQNAIYCPIHWPEIMGAKPGIREEELSLICDQRYSQAEINFEIELITEWMNTHQ